MMGQTLGHYRVLDKLGEGGMGEVYLAEDTTLDRRVALKVLPRELAESKERLDRFEREAKTLAALDHPNIVTIYSVESAELATSAVSNREDVGEGLAPSRAGASPAPTETVRFLTMQLVEGKPLSQLISEGGLPLERIYEIAIPLTDALATAHEKRVVHRDLKPSNVMVTAEGRVKVLDFGLAKLLAPRGTDVGAPLAGAGEGASPSPTEAATELMTEAGVIVGTMPYMSPEQLEGKEIDARSDIFSLGVVLYEMATGERPFQGETSASLIMSIGRDTPPEVDVVRVELPHHLGRVIAHCLEKDPERRYQSVKDVRNELVALRRETDSVSTQSVAGPLETEPSRRRRWWPAAVGFAVVVVAVLAIWLGQRRAPPEQAPEAPAQPPMIVVLPFDNLGAPEDEYFADGMTEEITSRLAAVGGLRVISRTSAMQYKEERPPMKQIGEELGVDFVLEGTVRWARTADGHGRVRITPQLIRVEDDSHLWADSYDRLTEDVFAVQSDIASIVIQQLGVTLKGDEQEVVEARRTDSPEAYQAYLRGQYLDHQPTFGRFHREAVVRAFEEAVKLDPDFAEAHAGLAGAHAGMIHQGFDTSEARREEARKAAQKALELAPDSPRVLLGVGRYQYRSNKDWEEAQGYYERAARALPNDAEPLEGIATTLQRLGRWEEAVESQRKAIALSPRDANPRSVLCMFLRGMRQYEEAVGSCDRSIALEPNQVYAYRLKAIAHLLWNGDAHQARAVWEASPIDWPFRSFRDLLLLERDYEEILERLESEEDPWFREQMYAYPWELERAQVLRLTGNEGSALEAFERARKDLEAELAKSPNDHRLVSALGIAHAGLGHRDLAVDYGRRGVELMPISKDALIGDHRLHDLALIYVMVDEPDLAVDQLETLLTIPSCYSASWYRLDPRLDPLREHPRFQALLEKYGQETG